MHIPMHAHACTCRCAHRVQRATCITAITYMHTHIRIPMQVCASCAEGYVQPYAGQSACLKCPSAGIACEKQAVVDVHPGWYRRPTGVNTSDSLLAFRCPKADACLGGEEAGNGSCAEGATGPLCGQCIDGYRRGRSACLVCVYTWCMWCVWCMWCMWCMWCIWCMWCMLRLP